MGACFCGPLNYIAFLCPLALLLADKRRIRCLAGRMGGSKKLSGNYFNQITGGLGDREKFQPSNSFLAVGCWLEKLLIRSVAGIRHLVLASKMAKLIYLIHLNADCVSPITYRQTHSRSRSLSLDRKHLPVLNVFVLCGVCLPSILKFACFVCWLCA